jgi:hypothetical protein
MIMCNLKYVFLAIVFLPVMIVQGQETTSCDAVLDQLNESKLIGDYYQAPLPMSSVGSQFLIDDWLNGDIYLSNKSIVRNKTIKYNAYHDRLIWHTPIGHQQVKLDKDYIEGFCLKGKSGETRCFKKIPVKYDLAFDSVTVFGEELYQNRISLFAYRKVVISGYEVALTDYYRDVYELSTLYLFKLENGKTIGFKRYKKKDIITLFPDKKEMIIAKLKELKQHRFRTEADLINITKVLNEVL